MPNQGFNKLKIGTFSGQEVGLEQAFPPFILALTVSAMFGRDFIHLIFAIGLVYMPAYIRLMRSEIRTVRERAFIEAAECAGNSTTRLLFRHLLEYNFYP